MSEVNSWPAAWSSALSSAKFSMIPLWMTKKRPLQSLWGWALAWEGRPWVAHRVCPMPTRPDSSVPLISVSRLSTLPAALSAVGVPSAASTTTPAES